MSASRQTVNNDTGDFELDIIGQQGLNIYTQICHCYSVSDQASTTTIIQTLELGLKRLAASFPWLAGQVVNEGASEGNTGVFRIKPLDETPRLITKDLRNTSSAPTWDDLSQSEFPFRMLDEGVIAPLTTLPLPGRDPTQRVFLVQATFIPGGLILTFLAHHAVMDGTGQGQVMYLLSKACRNQSFTPEELESANLARSNVIPLLDENYDLGTELDHQLLVPTPTSTHPTDDTLELPDCKWAYFIFNGAALRLLKSAVMKQLEAGYVSTDDVLCALIWISVARARYSRLNPSSNVTFARAVDVRRYLGIPTKYMGMAQNMTYNRRVAQELIKEPMTQVARSFRKGVDPITSDLGHMTRAYATYLSRNSNKLSINVTANLDSTVDIMLSSWAKLPCYELDFGLNLGLPQAVRRPQFTALEGLMYLMPKKPDGEVALALCLRDEDIEMLRSDPEFTKYGRYVA